MAQLTTKRSWARWGGILAVILLLLGLVWAVGATILSQVIDSRLKAAGFTQVSVSGVSLGWGTVRIERLGLGDAGSLRGVAADVTLSSLATGTIPSVRVDEVTARASLAEDGTVTIPGLTLSPSAGAPGNLPVGRIEIDHVRLTLTAPQGDFTVRGEEVEAIPRDSHLDIGGQVSLESPYGRLRGQLDATADLKTAGIMLSMEVEDGEAALAALSARGIIGTISLTKNANTSPAAQFDLTLAQASIGDWSLALGSLTGEWRDQRLMAQLTKAGETPTTDARLTADFSGNLPQVEGAGTLAFQNSGLSGTVRFDTRVSIDTGATPMGVQGQVQGEAAGIDYAGWGGGDGIAFKADLAGTAEALTLTFPEPVTGRLTPVAELLPEALSSYAGHALSFSAAFPESVRLEFGPFRLSAAPAIDLQEVDGATTAALSSPVDFQMREGGFLLSATGLTSSGTNVRWQETTADILSFKGRAQVAGADDWSITGVADVEATGSTGPARYEGLSLTWSGQIEAAMSAISLTPDACVEVHFRRLAFGPVTLSNVSPPCLDAPDGQPLLVSAGEEVRFNITVPAKAPLEVTLETEPRRRLQGRWPHGTLSGTSGANGLQQLTADLSDGTVRLEADGMALDAIGGRIDLSPDSSLKGIVKVGTIQSLHEPPFWTPLNIETTVSGSAEQYDFSAILSDELGILVFEATGSGTAEAGNADLTLYPVNFLSGATEAGDVSPFLADIVSGLSGTVSFNGQMGWGKTLASSGSLKLDGLGAAIASARMEGLQAEIDFASLWPPVTMERETIRLASLKAGVLLTNGTVGVETGADMPPLIGPVRFELAGGTVTAEPFMLDLGGTGETHFTLVAKDVDLERMIEEADIDGLSGTGTLEGALPVVITADGLQVEDGGLHAVANGQLQYRPDVLPPFLQGDDTRARMLRQVLQNFQYSQLSLSLGGGSGQDASQRVNVSAKGNNPDFLEGHPVELNFDFEGAILSALKSAVSITGAESLERLLNEQERQNTQ